MIGDSVVALADQITRGRATVNESAVRSGPGVFATRQAAAELRSLEKRARILFR